MRQYREKADNRQGRGGRGKPRFQSRGAGRPQNGRGGRSKEYGDGGALFENADKESSSHPDYRGSQAVTCPHCDRRTDYWMSAYWAEMRDGAEYLRISYITPKEDRRESYEREREQYREEPRPRRTRRESDDGPPAHIRDVPPPAQYDGPEDDHDDDDGAPF